ncbi:OmpA family protein [uncultured Desulfuromusa sp.]|uniref:OmpA family protein n=1 Tax=uncultured Desulfuromusa sp. TaxID=219183 RepID=UPI002AA70FF3|nr:OmpA family protein [uncultured Desulfuromusa sp.]
MKIWRINILLLGIVLSVGAECSWAVNTVFLKPETEILVRETADIGQATERHLPADQSFTPWSLDPSIFNEDQGDQVEMRQILEEDVKTVKLTDLVPAVRFNEGDAEIPDNYLDILRTVLEKMRDRANVRLHFIGHADSQPLSDELQLQYGDNEGLSRERAGAVAEYCQQALNLPAEAISYEGSGSGNPVADNKTEEGRALNRRVEVEVWYDEIVEKLVNKEIIVPRQVNRIKVCRSETVCKLRYKVGHSHRTVVKNLVSPLYFDDGVLSVPASFINQIRQALNHLKDKQNVLVRFTAYTDNKKLTGRKKRIYGHQLALSKAVARRVALAVQDDLQLPNAFIDSRGRGPTRPVAANDTPRGRALNRRIEVEFWHDDPLQELPTEPQICPEAAGSETISRVYNSPSGDIDAILFAAGQPLVSNRIIEQLRRAMNEVSAKTNVRLRFVGYTDNKRLNRRTAAIYGDDIGWSMARARRAMEAVSEKLGLTELQTEFEGRGFLQSDDVVNTGFLESDQSRVIVQVVYDELVVLDEYEGVEITRLNREVETKNPYALNLMRITIDGQPVDDPDKSIPDVQRCTDIALNNSSVAFKHDSLQQEPRLNITAWPRSMSYNDVAETEFVENRVEFQLYTNYRSFIDRSEVRIFLENQSIRDIPIAVIPLDDNGRGEWQADSEIYSAPVTTLKYLVRVYAADGLFDETLPQPMWLVDQIDPVTVFADPKTELLAGYGESRIGNRNIIIRGGTVQAHGTDIPPEHQVWLAGHAVPVDGNGNFVAEEILPEGLHTVEVAVLDKSGNGELFLRDMSLENHDWFNIGIVDLTLSGNKTNGPAKLLAPDNQKYSDDFSLDGRLAFYSHGKLDNGWKLTASADTREGPVDEIFSNFIDKSSDALFRRMDPDNHYPTLGDDSTVTENAPTRGKFYLKMEKHQSYGLWGNFKIGYTENNLAQVDRNLYGGNLHYEAIDTTSFGEPRLLLDGFGADPGTVAGRDEFRGTGGSLFFLRNQDILEGSERIRIEVRDKDSGLVIAVKSLTADLDYDIDYIQGRILLSEVLPTTAADNFLVETESMSGHPVFLVVRYEHTPGFSDPDTMVTGGKAHYWFGDLVKLGVVAEWQEEENIEKSLGGIDLTVRKTSNSWIKLEVARSRGSSVTTETSDDGGYRFSSDYTDDDSLEATAYRLDTAIGFADFNKKWRGRTTFYLQDLDGGYSAPGQSASEDITQYGGTLEVPVSKKLSGRMKLDKQIQSQGLETESSEINLDYIFNQNWLLSAGVRSDKRQDNSTTAISTQETGDRTDAVLRTSYDSRKRWTAYGFVQESIQTTGDRDDNGRIGVGGSWRLTDRFNLLGELSEGDLGTGASAGTEFLYTDRTTIYTNYALENERTDNGVLSKKGNMVSGFRSRYSDSASVYLEEQYTHGNVPTGLVHSTGVELAASDRLNFSANLDYGTLKDPDTAAELERVAVAASVGYGFNRLAFASGLEYRVDNTEQSDSSFSERTTWLFKNNFKFQLSADWRIVGKFNYSQSESSLGKSYDSDYTEAVVGYAYRPVEFDRLNVLLKYTYFYNFPAGSDSDSDFIQRTHIGAIDAMYDLTPHWTLGGKYAYRFSQVAQDPENPEYFDSRALLYVLRADWHFLHRWDALMEARMLDLPDAQDRKSGVLLALYRHLGSHLKLGAGYNFSDFSDDLTQMDYQHQGFFINLIGKL